VILDLTVPAGMGGMECFAELRRLDPDVKVVVSSGYSNAPVLADYERTALPVFSSSPTGCRTCRSC